MTDGGEMKVNKQVVKSTRMYKRQENSKDIEKIETWSLFII